MKNDQKISRRQWMLLSAYIDGQLSKRDQEKIEQLLRDSPVHREAVKKMRLTRSILAMLPVRRVPRNFTISAEEVKQPSIPSFFSVLRYAAVATALLLFVVLGIDFLPGVYRGLETTAARDAKPEMLAVELVEAEDGEPPDIIFWGGPPMVGGVGMGGGGDGSIPIPPQFHGIGGGGVEGTVPEAVIPEEEFPLEEALPPLGEIEQAAPLEDVEEESAAEPAEEQALEKAPSGEESTVGVVDAGPILGLPPADQRGEITPSLGFEPLLARPQGQFPLRIVEIVLTALLAVLGIPAWLLSRRKRE